jgi:epoxyqueuosine reductase
MNKQKPYIDGDSICRKAKESGFDSCGIALPEILEQEALQLEHWLRSRYHGSMQYMERHFEKRINPHLMLEDLKSIIVLSYNYFPSRAMPEDTYRIAKYAYGKDYHEVIKKKLFELTAFIETLAPGSKNRVFVDTAPVMEKAWAVRAGLGWIGKNSLLLQKRRGSYFSLGVIFSTVAVRKYAVPFTANHCGTCNLCVEACPTGAILPGKNMIDARRCISYLNTELKDDIPETYRGRMANYIFGCDICQEVCPWNSFSLPHTEPLYDPHPDLLQMNKQDWEELKEETFREIFHKSAVKRRKYTGLIKVIRLHQSS